jgi:hypothetical protein
MEDQASWNEVEKAISQAMTEHDQSIKEGAIGGSVVLHIYETLKTKGYLKDQF